MIFVLQVAWKSEEEGKDAEGSTHEMTIDVEFEFVSADTPTLPHEQADPQSIERWITSGYLGALIYYAVLSSPYLQVL